MLRIIFLIPFCLAVAVTHAETVGLSDDGRQVRLNDDGSWEYISSDRFATTVEGQRVRLKPDGSWEPADDQQGWVAVPSERVAVRRDLHVDGDSRMELLSWRIESARDKRKKNNTLRSQMLIEVEVSGAALTRVPAMRELAVRDSRGREYPVEHVSRPVATGDGSGRITIVADGSPRWFGIKFFELEVNGDGTGRRGAITLVQSMADVVEDDVEALTEF